MMKRVNGILVLLFCSLLFVGCEKDFTEDDNGKDNKENPASPDDGGSDDDTTWEDALSVAEAQSVEEGTVVCVKAYIVASTTRSLKNAEFKAPFTYSSAIVIADKPAESLTGDDALMPVCLTDRKKARADLNLVDHPENWNRLIYIIGTREKYMSVPGLKKVSGYGE